MRADEKRELGILHGPVAVGDRAGAARDSLDAMEHAQPNATVKEGASRFAIDCIAQLAASMTGYRDLPAKPNIEMIVLDRERDAKLLGSDVDGPVEQSTGDRVPIPIADAEIDALRDVNVVKSDVPKIDVDKLSAEITRPQPSDIVSGRRFRSQFHRRLVAGLGRSGRRSLHMTSLGAANALNRLTGIYHACVLNQAAAQGSSEVGLELGARG